MNDIRRMKLWLRELWNTETSNQNTKTQPQYSTVPFFLTLYNLNG